MDFPRAAIAIAIVFIAYLSLQFFLLIRVREILLRRAKGAGIRKVISAAVAGFFGLMLLPPLWLRFFVPYFAAPRSSAGQVLVILFSVWGVGSTGAALILLGDALWRTIMSLFRAEVTPVDIQRRKFLKRSVGVAAAAPFLVSGYGTVLARRRFQVEEFPLRIDGLSSALTNFSIVHLTDIHVGPFMKAEELADHVEAANRLKPDLIALTGDFIASRRDEVAPCVETLARLKARHGIFACLGNHDHFGGAKAELIRQFRQHGVRVLENEAVSIRVGNTTLNILGIDDLLRGTPDLAEALTGAAQHPGEARILLSHRPEIFPTAAASGIEAVLGGHYHGGQIKLSPDPDALSIARFITPYADGLFYLSRRRQEATAAKGSVLFVSRGIGITALPIRINCPPQIAHLILKKS
ncbi:MAG: metallophosphoesterase [Deltaproteobacteria bacterium]|nr:metallophosphoesterase [Deltaproteobacteria bacterium]